MKVVSRSSFFVVIAVLSLALCSARAQMPGMDAATLKLFGDNKSFTTDEEVANTATNGNLLMGMSMKLSMLNGETRTELDVEQAKGIQGPPPQVIQQLKMANMTKSINIIKPDTKTMLIIYPGASTCVEFPMAPQQVAQMSQEPNITKTKIGTETVDGHPCIKYKVVITAASGQKTEFTVWAATNLNEFPVRLETITPFGKTTITYKNTKLAKPDASTFAAPAGFTKYNSMQAFQTALRQKMMGGAGAPK